MIKTKATEYWSC